MPRAPRSRSSRTAVSALLAFAALVLGGFCVYGTIFSPLFQTWILGPHPDPRTLARFNVGMGWVVGGAIILMIASFLFLLIDGVQLIGGRVRRTPPVCTHCGQVEAPRTLPFRRVPIPGTGWQEVTCPQCRHQWHTRL